MKLLLLLAVTLLPAEIRVIDGDTLAIGAERVRVRGLDAPEVGGRAACPLEAERGAAAAEAAAGLLSRAERVEVESAGRDRYGRLVGEVALCDAGRCQDFAAAMIAAGHGARWRGRKREWC